MFSQDHVKTFVEDFLISKLVEFSWRGINELRDEWQKVNQKNLGYNTGLNLIIVWLFIKKIKRGNWNVNADFKMFIFYFYCNQTKRFVNEK